MFVADRDFDLHPPSHGSYGGASATEFSGKGVGELEVGFGAASAGGNRHQDQMRGRCFVGIDQRGQIARGEFAGFGGGNFQSIGDAADLRFLVSERASAWADILVRGDDAQQNDPSIPLRIELLHGGYLSLHLIEMPDCDSAVHVPLFLSVCWCFHFS